MKIHNTLRFLLISAVFCITCPVFAQHFYYAPNAVHIPMMSEKNDAALTVGIGRGSGYRALEVQAAYSPLRHVAIMFNYFDAGSKEVERLKETGGRGKLTEAGAGVYQGMTNGCISLLAGYGQGYFFNNYGLERISRFEVQRWFVQPALMYQDKFFRGGLAIRLNRLYYSEGETAFNIDENELNAIQNIEERSVFFLPELGIHTGINFAPFALNLSLTTIFPKTYNLNFARFNSNFSLTLDIGRMVKKEGKGK